MGREEGELGGKYLEEEEMLWECDDVKIWPRRSCHDAAQRRTSMALECDAEPYILDDADGTNLTKRLSAYY